MLERSATLESAVHKAIIDIGDKNIMTSDRKIDMIREIVRCLNLMQLGADSLRRGGTGLFEDEAALKFVLSCLEKEGNQLAKRFYDALRLRIHQRRSEAEPVLQALHNNLLPQDEEESEMLTMTSQKEVDQCITRMLLWVSGARIGDAVSESEGEDDAEQFAAEPTPKQQLQRAPVTEAKSRVPGAPGRVGRPKLSKTVKKELLNFPVSGKEGPLTTKAYKWLKASKRKRQSFKRRDERRI